MRCSSGRYRLQVVVVVSLSADGHWVTQSGVTSHISNILRLSTELPAQFDLQSWLPLSADLRALIGNSSSDRTDVLVLQEREWSQ